MGQYEQCSLSFAAFLLYTAPCFVLLLSALFFREKAVFFHYPLKTRLGMWYGFTCDAMDRCTNDQIARYIDMPRWLVAPMKGVHNLLQFIRKKR